MIFVVSEPNSLGIGTSAFTVNGWRSTFYPERMRPADHLSYYATKFDTVEVDSTFYGSPSVSTVKARNAKTPSGFIFAAKVPQTITHERVLRRGLWVWKDRQSGLSCVSSFELTSFAVLCGQTNQL